MPNSSTYELPDPLVGDDGRAVATVGEWTSHRRRALVAAFAAHVYGTSPPRPRVTVTLQERAEGVCGGLATRSQARVAIGDGADRAVELLVHVPVAASGPVPVFIGPNYFGNHSFDPDPGIILHRQLMRRDPTTVQVNAPLPADFFDDPAAIGEAFGRERGMHASRWPLRAILGAGFAVATWYDGDVCPDWPAGCRAHLDAMAEAAGAPEPAIFTWGAIAAWAWGNSVVLDALAAIPGIDTTRAVVVGHSRHGKAALWTAATDPRFAMAIANNSGTGGAKLARRTAGETIAQINASYPHWFAERYRAFAGRETELPVDQHMLIGLIAPRPVYIACASADGWADPEGEFLSVLHAEPVFALHGKAGFGSGAFPAPGERVWGPALAYHLREGGHDITAYDWERFIGFARQAI